MAGRAEGAAWRLRPRAPAHGDACGRGKRHAGRGGGERGRRATQQSLKAPSHPRVFARSPRHCHRVRSAVIGSRRRSRVVRGTRDHARGELADSGRRRAKRVESDGARTLRDFCGNDSSYIFHCHQADGKGPAHFLRATNPCASLQPSRASGELAPRRQRGRVSWRAKSRFRFGRSLSFFPLHRRRFCRLSSSGAPSSR